MVHQWNASAILTIIGLNQDNVSMLPLVDQMVMLEQLIINLNVSATQIICGMSQPTDVTIFHNANHTQHQELLMENGLVFVIKDIDKIYLKAHVNSSQVAQPTQPISSTALTGYANVMIITTTTKISNAVIMYHAHQTQLLGMMTSTKSGNGDATKTITTIKTELHAFILPHAHPDPSQDSMEMYLDVSVIPTIIGIMLKAFVTMFQPVTDHIMSLFSSVEFGLVVAKKIAILQEKIVNLTQFVHLDLNSMNSLKNANASSQANTWLMVFVNLAEKTKNIIQDTRNSSVKLATVHQLWDVSRSVTNGKNNLVKYVSVNQTAI